jgi:hypothetical protein
MITRSMSGYIHNLIVLIPFGNTIDGYRVAHNPTSPFLVAVVGILFELAKDIPLRFRIIKSSKQPPITSS